MSVMATDSRYMADDYIVEQLIGRYLEIINKEGICSESSINFRDRARKARLV